MKPKSLWILALLATLTLFLGLSSGCTLSQVIKPGTMGVTINSSQAYSMIEKNKNNADFIILDVRTPEEYSNEHIAVAILLDFYADDFENELNKLDKSKTYLVYCRSGNRSSKSMPLMGDLGFIKTYDMVGGINQWKVEGYPTV